MATKAKLSYHRQAPTKIRPLASLVSGLAVVAAEAKLAALNKRAAQPILKLLRSAVANATHNQKLNKDDLVVKQLIVDQGPTLKRSRARARGSAAPIRKRTSHVTIILDIKSKKSS
jgi:large subunit ribosomal protein L22